jgi:putative phosphoribosyl transferase
MDGFLDGTWHEAPGGRFLNRYHAGRGIAAKFGAEILSNKGKGVIVGLPRGGVEVAAAVATDLDLPLDFRAVRKVGHPLQPEFAIGAVDISGAWIVNPYLHSDEMPSESQFEQMVQKALEQAKKIEAELRPGGISVARTADWCVVVDDGAATGLTIIAAVNGLKSEGKTVHVAVPVASEQAVMLIEEVADSFHALMVPGGFMAVGQFYQDFDPVPMEEVRKYLK